MPTYWDHTLKNRLSRRRALAGTAGIGAAAAFLAACGGSSNDSGGSTSDKSGLIAEPVDTTSRAKAGGTIKDYHRANILHFDVAISNTSSVSNDVAAYAYSRLTKYGVTKYPKVWEGAIEGDMMDTWEISPDKLTYTMKLRQGMKWDSRAPTNGRVVDTNDVLETWKRFVALNPASVNLAYDERKAPSAAIEQMTSPDARTIVLKLRQPDPSLLTVLSGFDQFYVMPKEASDGGFDPKTTVRGHGPWMLDEYRPSAFIHWKKNPDYYVKERPYPDRLERPLVPEYSTRLAQFKSGNIYTDVVEDTQQDVLQLKKDVPQTLLRQGAASYGKSFRATTGNIITFGYEGNSIFKDARVRQAVSMSIDREAFSDAVENRPAFAKEGLEMDVKYNTNLSPAWSDAWLDPQDDKKFGANNKFLKFNVAEAKKLLAAAGHPNGVEFDFYYNREDTYGALYTRQLEIYTAMFLDVGLKAKMQPVSYSVFIPQYHVAYIPANFAATKGFSGMVLVAERSRYSPVLSLYGMIHPNGDSFHGATANGSSAEKGDPKLNADLERLRVESDKAKLQAGIYDVQRYMTEQSYMIPKPSNAVPYTVWWPALGNQGAFSSTPVGANRWVEHNLPWWIDETKAPIGKS